MICKLWWRSIRFLPERTRFDSETDHHFRIRFFIGFLYNPLFIVMTKQCRKCQTIKSIYDFTPRRTSKDGRHSYCKDCISAMMRDHYAEDPSRKQTKNRERENRLLAEVNELKARAGCCFCGEKEPVALDFHHVDPATKHRDVSSLCHSKSRNKVFEEIKKCVIICATDHRKLEAGLIKLPVRMHQFQIGV